MYQNINMSQIKYTRGAFSIHHLVPSHWSAVEKKKMDLTTIGKGDRLPFWPTTCNATIRLEQ